MKNKIFSKKLKGMTLTELLVVLVILGILMLLAIPGYQYLVQDAHSKEAELQLVQLCKNQKTYFLKYSKYGNELKGVRFEHSKMVSDGGTANYTIEIVNSDNQNFLARATSVTDFDGDGQFNVWEIDKECIPKEIVED